MTNRIDQTNLPIAEDVEFDNSTNGFTADDTQAAIEEVNDAVINSASPGFAWGRSGNNSSGTFLLNDTVNSNRTGRLVPFDGIVTEFYVVCENNTTATLELLKRPCATGGAWTQIATVSLTAARCGNSTGLTAAVNLDDELSVRIVSGTFRNPVAGVIIKNSAGSGGGGSSTGLVKVTSNDTTADFLANKVVAGTGITLTELNDGGNETLEISAASGSGEANTGSNVGGGEGVFKQKVGVDLEFRSLVAGANVNLISGTDTITIDATDTGEANTASNVGGGADIFKQKTGVDLEFKTLTTDSNIVLTENTDDVQISIPSFDVNKNSILYVYDTTGGLNLNAGWTDVTLDTDSIVDSIYSFTAGTSNITINQNGTYKITYHLGTDISTGNARSNSQARLQEDTGGGFITVPGSIGNMYNRNAAQGKDSCSAVVVRNYTVGDIVKLQAQRESGTSTIITDGNTVGITIEYMRA